MPATEPASAPRMPGRACGSRHMLCRDRRTSLGRPARLQAAAAHRRIDFIIRFESVRLALSSAVIRVIDFIGAPFRRQRLLGNQVFHGPADFLLWRGYSAY